RRSIFLESRTAQKDEKREQHRRQPHRSDPEVNNGVMKEDYINHVRKRVNSRLKDIIAKCSCMVSRQIVVTTAQHNESKRSTKHRMLLSDG
ncbi:unnamed protein product, partial [Rotaria sp. Silwood2]